MTTPPTCLLCGTRLPPDRRWRIIQLLWPRRPVCEPSERCYRGLARRMGFEPSDEHVAEQVARARRIR